jgi:5-formyltetrahydrofolate cyclo-ligase
VSDTVIDKQHLRRDLKARRLAHVDAIPPAQRNLLFRRPPTALTHLIPADTVISVYHEMPGEAPATHYARWFYEQGHRVVLPWFADRAAPMMFREWANPFIDDLLVPDPFRAAQPTADAAEFEPQVVFVPLLGFTITGERIGYGGGHYDRWLAAHPQATAIGLAWDCQLVESLPLEAHDIPLAAIVTPTRLYGPF